MDGHQELLSNGVKYVVRVCEPTYDMKSLEEAGIQTYVCCPNPALYCSHLITPL